MKKHSLVIGCLIAIGFLCGSAFGMPDKETVWDGVTQGTYAAPGTVDGDLVVTYADVDIFGGDLIVNGDLKVTNGFVRVCGGDLKVDGDLIVTNNVNDAFVLIEGGNLEVTGAIITKGDSEAYVLVKSNENCVDQDPYPPYAGGSLRAGRISTSGGSNAYVACWHHIDVAGAIVTRSRYGHSFVYSRGVDEPCGNIYAGEIFTYSESPPEDYPYFPDACEECPPPDRSMGIMRNGSSKPSVTGASVMAENGHVTVAGPIVTYAGLLDGENGGEAMSFRPNGHPYGYHADAFVFAEGNIKAASITTFALHDAFVSGELVLIDGDIRTDALGVEDPDCEGYRIGGHAYVEARRSLLDEVDGTFEDVIAQNIYTKGYRSAYVRAFRHVELRGDIVTWETRESVPQYNNNSAFVSAGYFSYFFDPYPYCEYDTYYNDDNGGHIKAQNISTKTPTAAYVWALSGIDVAGEILTKSLYGKAYVYSEHCFIKAGNIATDGCEDASVYAPDGNVDVTRVISTKEQECEENGEEHYSCESHYDQDCGGPPDPEKCYNNGRGAEVLADGNESCSRSRYRSNGEAYAKGNIYAEKIFTQGYGSSRVEADCDILVKGPISTISFGSDANVDSDDGSIIAGAISTHGDCHAYVEADEGDIIVTEDIRTKSNNASCDRNGSVYAYVCADGRLEARSIRTEMPNGSNDEEDSIESDQRGRFTFVPTPGDEVKIIKNGIFNFDSDHEWNTELVIKGECTINGNGHTLNFGPNGVIRITDGAELNLKNIVLRNIETGRLVFDDAGDLLSVHNVTIMLSDDYEFDQGRINVRGCLHIKGARKQAVSCHNLTEDEPWDPCFNFIYVLGTDERLEVRPNSKILIDDEVRLDFRYIDMSRSAHYEHPLLMADESSHLHFNHSRLRTNQDIEFTKGTFVFDNQVIFEHGPFESLIVIGDGIDEANNVVFDFHEASKLWYTDAAAGDPPDTNGLVYQNVVTV